MHASSRLSRNQGSIKVEMPADSVHNGLRQRSDSKQAILAMLMQEAEGYLPQYSSHLHCLKRTVPVRLYRSCSFSN
jgi:hypothetical protein